MRLGAGTMYTLSKVVWKSYFKYEKWKLTLKTMPKIYRRRLKLNVKVEVDCG